MFNSFLLIFRICEFHADLNIFSPSRFNVVRLKELYYFLTFKRFISNYCYEKNQQDPGGKPG